MNPITKKAHRWTIISGREKVAESLNLTMKQYDNKMSGIVEWNEEEKTKIKSKI